MSTAAVTVYCGNCGTAEGEAHYAIGCRTFQPWEASDPAVSVPAAFFDLSEAEPGYDWNTETEYMRDLDEWERQKEVAS